MKQEIFSVLRKIQEQIHRYLYIAPIVVIAILIWGQFNQVSILETQIDILSSELTEANQALSDINLYLKTEIAPGQSKNRVELLRAKAAIETLTSVYAVDKIRQTKTTVVRKVIRDTIKELTKEEYTKHLTRDETNRMAINVVNYCEEYNIPINLFLALIRQESGFNPRAVSKKGAMGLTQIMPGTAEQIAKQLGIQKYNMFDIRDNIKFGAFYLAQMLDKFYQNQQYALQAYNAGPTRIDNYIDGIKSLPLETMVYEKRIRSFAEEYASAGIF